MTARLTPTGVVLRLRGPQVHLLKLALAFHEDLAPGDRSLRVHLGADRAEVARLKDKVARGEGEFRPEEVHVLVMALRSAAVVLHTGPQFYERMDRLYREDALAVAQGLEDAVLGSPGTGAAHP